MAHFETQPCMFLLPLWHADMRNSFNLLLVALACFDNVYLLGGVLEAVHRRDTIQLNRN